MILANAGKSENKLLGSPVSNMRNGEIMAILDDKVCNGSPEQRFDIKDLIEEFKQIFGDTPSVTNSALIDIDVGGADPIKQHSSV